MGRKRLLDLRTTGRERKARSRIGDSRTAQLSRTAAVVSAYRIGGTDDDQTDLCEVLTESRLRPRT